MCDNAAPFNTKEVVYKVVTEFLQNIDDISDPKTILSDEDFDRVMETSDIKNRLADGFVSAEDGIAIGVNIGFRMGVAKLANDILAGMKPAPDATDIIEVDPVLLPAT